MAAMTSRRSRLVSKRFDIPDWQDPALLRATIDRNRPGLLSFNLLAAVLLVLGAGMLGCLTGLLWYGANEYEARLEAGDPDAREVHLRSAQDNTEMAGLATLATTAAGVGLFGVFFVRRLRVPRFIRVLRDRRANVAGLRVTSHRTALQHWTQVELSVRGGMDVSFEVPHTEPQRTLAIQQVQWLIGQAQPA